ncbi:MAG TPA: DUF998 domain-containing protein [Jatrophihabitantaceae bacterium]|jgi:hypothetical membrane protein
MRPALKRVPGWALLSAVVAPVALIGGWLLAGHLQPPGYSLLHQSISSLAARGAHDRWIMTGALVLLGSCHLITAVGLRPARALGRATLAIGGLATLAVAAFPQPHSGTAATHVAAATIGFIALAVWPVLAARGVDDRLLTLAVSATASASLLGLLTWLTVALNTTYLGLSERCLTGAQALWPLAVALNAQHVAAPPPQAEPPESVTRR